MYKLGICLWFILELFTVRDIDVGGLSPCLEVTESAELLSNMTCAEMTSCARDNCRSTRKSSR